MFMLSTKKSGSKNAAAYFAVTVWFDKPTWQES